MYRFFVGQDQIEEKVIHITGEDRNHIRNVLRMKPGEEILISSGENKEYHCAVEAFTDTEVLAEIRYVQETDFELPSRIYLFQGLPKGDKMEFILQKAVELGVYEVIPVAAKRCVVKLDAKKEAAKCRRWEAISESAAKQSKRMVIPKVTNVMTFSEAVRYASQLDIKLIPYELAKGMSETKDLLEGITPGQSIGIFIGPEGGFEESEVEQAKAAGVMPVTLGRRILRTETAGMTILSILMYLLEN